MARRFKPKEIVAKLRQVEMLTAQGKSGVEAIHSMSVTDGAKSTALNRR
jgi:hypothetical protein